MKIIHAVAFISLLLSHSTSVAKDPKRADVDLRQDESAKHRTPRVASPIILPLVKTFPAIPRSRGLTSIGGPAANSKSTAAISGTGLNR